MRRASEGGRFIVEVRNMKKRMVGGTEVYDENKGCVLISLAPSNWLVYG